MPPPLLIHLFKNTKITSCIGVWDVVSALQREIRIQLVLQNALWNVRPSTLCGLSNLPRHQIVKSDHNYFMKQTNSLTQFLRPRGSPFTSAFDSINVKLIEDLEQLKCIIVGFPRDFFFLHMVATPLLCYHYGNKCEAVDVAQGSFLGRRRR